MTFEEIKQGEETYIMHTYGRFPIALDHGKGATLWDTDGKKYIDLTSGIGVNSLGHDNEALTTAVSEQAHKLMHACNLYYTEPMVQAAKKLVDAAGMGKIFFANSGAEANEGMIKLARKYSFDKYSEGRNKIITLKQSFHGRTVTTLKATGQDKFHQYFFPFTEGFDYAAANDIEDMKRKIDDTTCAVMMEMIQGEGGVLPLDKEFVQATAEICKEKDILLLIDEVQTGWCRTGAVMSYMNYGIKPDIVSMAKGLGGGMPIGAICATEEVAKAFTPGSHGTTFGGHPVCCAAALAEVGELLDRDLAGNAKKVGDYFAAKLEKLPHVKEVRHQGLLVGVEFDDTISGVDVKHGAFDRKMLITAIGAHIIRMVPPLIVSEEECDKAFEILDETVKSLS